LTSTKHKKKPNKQIAKKWKVWRTCETTCRSLFRTNRIPYTDIKFQLFWPTTSQTCNLNFFLIMPHLRGIIFFSVMIQFFLQGHYQNIENHFWYMYVFFMIKTLKIENIGRKKIAASEVNPGRLCARPPLYNVPIILQSPCYFLLLFQYIEPLFPLTLKWDIDRDCEIMVGLVVIQRRMHFLIITPYIMYSSTSFTVMWARNDNSRIHVLLL
jgi:hypothetical protein